MTPKNEISFWKKHFRTLRGWKIYYFYSRKHKAQCFFDVKNKTAAIYSYGKNRPKDYIFHEMLHIAIKASQIDDSKTSHQIRKEKEEILVQDLSKIYFPKK
jgi:hypothetical protein